MTYDTSLSNTFFNGVGMWNGDIWWHCSGQKILKEHLEVQIGPKGSSRPKAAGKIAKKATGE
jgi:hypothetical protein